jgi:rhodanese-related sulfurtransferase
LKEIFNRKTAAAFLLLSGLFLAISPAGLREASNISPKEIMTSIISKSDHVSAEQVAEWIINKRPDLLIVDIRSSDEYNQYHIPGAVNLPLAKLFESESLELLNDDFIIVLCSNGGTHAAQAWVLLKQLRIDSYVLLGGLNYWAQAILNPQPPDDLVADQEILQYQFQKAASEYFKGGIPIEENKTQNEIKPIPKTKQKKRKAADEGC